jgi:hypothetical protein
VRGASDDGVWVAGGEARWEEQQGAGRAPLAWCNCPHAAQAIDITIKIVFFPEIGRLLFRLFRVLSEANDGVKSSSGFCDA